MVAAAPDRVFAFSDNPERLVSHMSKSSWRMGWGHMTTTVDGGLGQQVGSHIRMRGRLLGIALSLDEVVIEREAPMRKVWETVGSPRLLVIASYRMGFEATPRVGGTQLRVFIDYGLPNAWPTRWLGHLFGNYYAHWCTRSMVNDAVRQFASPETSGFGGGH